MLPLLSLSLQTIELLAYKEKHGNIDVKNDVKLRGWVLSIIRKLNINSVSLNGEKMDLINKHEGLRDYLLQKELVEMAREDADASRQEKNAARRSDKKAKQAGNAAGKEEDKFEELKEDDEVNAFMESGLTVPTVV